MARLIDADVLKGKLIRELNKTGKYTPYECGLDDALSYLDEQPTVDAVTGAAERRMIMKAIVCDKCGKTVLLEDHFTEPRGINKLYLGKEEVIIDLCDECTDELIAALRKENDYG